MAIAILGLGKTGISLAQFFSDQGEEVWGIDDRPDFDPGSQQACFQKLYLGGKTPSWESVDRIFISPGVPPEHPAALAARKKGKILEGELDLAYSHCSGEIIAITGTNGKSTTTALVGEILKSAGLAVGVGGNFGTPFLDLVRNSESYSHFVLEVSSFQLESTQKFHPKIAVLLNLSDDHFDRHRTLNEYLQAKRKIFAFQTEKDFAVYNDDDLHVLEATETIPPARIPFSTAKKVKGAFESENKIIWAPEGNPSSTFDLSHCSLRGLHNLENICAAVACAKLLGLEDPPIQTALDQFQGLPHRVEWVQEIGGVAYYDDSKATNVGAVVMSLASFDQEVVLILGGRDKGGDYSPLKPLLKAKARALIVLGEAAKKIRPVLSEATEYFEVENMEQAVRKSHELARAGGTVLLSPACSSFDMYKDYHARGEDFKKWVRKLGSEAGR